MTEHWEIVLDNEERGRRVSLLEGRARLGGALPEAEDAEFSLIFYVDQVSLNVPASTEGRAFIARLTEILGPPRVEPTIKCSCSWGEGVMGAMVAVLWDLPPEAAPARLKELHAFLGRPQTEG